MDEQRRYRVMRIDMTEAVFMFNAISAGLHGKAAKYDFARTAIHSIPADAECLAVKEDFFTRTLSFLIKSSEFDPVPPGEEVPLLDGADMVSRRPADDEMPFVVAARPAAVAPCGSI